MNEVNKRSKVALLTLDESGQFFALRFFLPPSVPSVYSALELIVRPDFSDKAH